jgi:hypothetical protein
MREVTAHGTRPTPLEEFHRNGYYFRAAATLTIAMGVFLHLVRVFFGDDLTIEYLFTPTFDMVLVVPMTYSAISGIAVWRRVEFVNRPHKIFFTWTLIYITGSIPLHFYFSIVKGDLGPYLRFFPMWFSYLLFVVYGAFLVLFWRLRFKEVRS